MAGVVLRSKWLWIGMGVVVVIAGSAWGIGGWILNPGSGVPKPVGDPDPGGQILKSISTVELGLPSDAKVSLSQQVEPAWDSCDGIKGTFGWNDVQVHYLFTTGQSLTGLIAAADIKMRAAGWTTTGRGAWTRPVNGGTATASLTRDGGPKSRHWELNADAPPIGPQATGC